MIAAATSITEAVAHAGDAGLRYVTDEEPGYTRHRSGKGFTWRDPDGATVTDPAVRARIDGLAVPPAWTDVWACRDARGHLQATGRDAKGRKQYRYHQRWREVRDSAKFDRMREFGLALPDLRRSVEEHLSMPGLPRDKVRAAVVWLLDETMIRIGNDEYARANESFGLTTLRNRHARVDGHTVRFCFRAKGGLRRSVALQDRRMASIVRRCKDLPGQVLFEYEDDDAPAGVRAVGSADVNDYLGETTGDCFTAKDFRTWGASVHALAHLRGCPPPHTKREADANAKAAIEEAASLLGNTPAVCRASYVSPAVLDSYAEGRLSDLSPPRSPRALGACERLLLSLCDPG